MAEQDNGIGLTELLTQVKQELVAASLLSKVSQSNNSNLQPTDIPLFAYGDIELELQVTVKKDAKAGLKISVLEFGGGASRDDVQKIKVKLEPLFTKVQLLEILGEQNPKLLEYIKKNAFYASTKGANKANLDDGIE